MKKFKITGSLILAIYLTGNAFSQGALTSVTSFGSNPGNLTMYCYVPSGITQTASLVVALHGCTQTALNYSDQSGWNKLANRHKFIVIYPEQVSSNNSSKCFNWYESGDQTKGQGEALSIKQMVDYMKANYTIDTTKIFVTGLSAGGGMTSIMLAAYPEIFNKGAIMAGLPYKAATSSLNAYSAMNGNVTKTPAQWGDLVRNQNTSYTGAFPDVAIFHGSSDATVNITNATELIDQWTNVNSADQTADATNSSFQGNTSVEQKIYNDNFNNPVVYSYKITGMGHAISLDTGSCPRQGGSTATYAIEKNFHSTYWAADFFGIVTNPYSITGAIQVTQNGTNVTYSVTNTIGSSYTWSVPTGASVISGQGTNSIVVNFGVSSGLISVQETTIGGCINDAASLYVTVSYTVTVAQTSSIACHGSATGMLSVTATGGASPYSYSWSPSGGTAAITSGLPAGIYTVTVTDNTSVVVTSTSFTVTEPFIIAGSQTITLCAGQTITVGIHTYNSSNTYIDTLTASNNCDSILITYLTVHPLSPVTLNITGNDSLCNTDGAFALSGGSPAGGVYSGAAINSGNFNPVAAGAGWNVVTYSVTDGNGCTNVSKDSLFVNTCFSTGMSDNDLSKSNSVYPNPADDVITISTKGNGPLKVKLYNSMGVLILLKEFNATTARLDIHTFKNGIYLLSITTEQESFTHRIIKQ
ncbi:MAG: PHB depolymerase family esterase [Bacteroidota bacterium]